MVLSALLLVGYLLLLKSCITINPKIEKIELTKQTSKFLPQEAYYFDTKKYLFSYREMDVLSGNGMLEDPVYAYGINNQHNEVILKPFSTDFLKLVKISEMDVKGQIHEEVVWWSKGRVRSKYYFPFLEDKSKDEFFTQDGRKYRNQHKDFSIVKDTYQTYLIDRKKQENSFNAYDMYWKSPTEIVYRLGCETNQEIMVLPNVK